MIIWCTVPPPLVSCCLSIKDMTRRILDNVVYFRIFVIVLFMCSFFPGGGGTHGPFNMFYLILLCGCWRKDVREELLIIFPSKFVLVVLVNQSFQSCKSRLYLLSGAYYAFPVSLLVRLGLSFSIMVNFRYC